MLAGSAAPEARHVRRMKRRSKAMGFGPLGFYEIVLINDGDFLQIVDRANLGGVNARLIEDISRCRGTLISMLHHPCCLIVKTLTSLSVRHSLS